MTAVSRVCLNTEIILMGAIMSTRLFALVRITKFPNQIMQAHSTAVVCEALNVGEEFS